MDLSSLCPLSGPPFIMVGHVEPLESCASVPATAQASITSAIGMSGRRFQRDGSLLGWALGRVFLRSLWKAERARWLGAARLAVRGLGKSSDYALFSRIRWMAIGGWRLGSSTATRWPSFPAGSIPCGNQQDASNARPINHRRKTRASISRKDRMNTDTSTSSPQHPQHVLLPDDAIRIVG